MMRRCCLLLLVAATMPMAHAANMISIEVAHDQGTYTMQSVIWFDAGVEQVYSVFRHWDNATKFSSAIVDSRDMPPDAQGRPQFYVRNRGCVLFFCTTFERRGYIEAETNIAIFAFTDPATSDFNLSNESWHFRAGDGGTVVTYNLEMQPKFWVPPGIGPFLIKRKLKDDGSDAVARIEALAQAISSD